MLSQQPGRGQRHLARVGQVAEAVPELDQELQPLLAGSQVRLGAFSFGDIPEVDGQPTSRSRVDVDIDPVSQDW